MLLAIRVQVAHAYQCLLTVSDPTVNSVGAVYTVDWLGLQMESRKYTDLLFLILFDVLF